MRVLVCTFVIFATACGKADKDPNPESSGGTQGSGALGGASQGGSAAGGLAAGGRSQSGASQGGRSSGGSGASVSVGSGGAATAGAAGAASGASATGGSAWGGASGAGGAGITAGAGTTGGEGGETGTISSCDDTYTACGCGCCGGVTPTKRCFYPELPGHLASIIEEDESIRSSPDCANAGCSAPQEYVCCTSDQATLGEATYKVTVLATALDRLTISRTDDQYCDQITFVYASATRDDFRIEAPAKQWIVQDSRVQFCSQSSINQAVGGVGHLTWHGAPCVADFDFTLFASFERSGRRAVRFKAENVPLSNGTLLGCD